MLFLLPCRWFSFSYPNTKKQKKSEKRVGAFSLFLLAIIGKKCKNRKNRGVYSGFLRICAKARG
jgi:hypothetical protein